MLTLAIDLFKRNIIVPLRFLFVVLQFFIFVFPINAQTEKNAAINVINCKTPKVLELNPNEIFKVENISDKLAVWTSQNGNKFPLEATDANILNCVKEFNKHVENAKQKIAQNISYYNLHLNDLIENQDLTKLEEQIDAKVKSLAEIKTEFKSQLQSISIKKVYAVVLNISAEEDINADEQLNMARNFVASKAIEEVNGILIKSLQKLRTSKEQTELIEWVEQNIQGNMEMDPTYTLREGINDHEKKLFIITVKVYPFKPLSKASNDKASAPNGSVILDEVNEGDFVGLKFLPGRKEKVLERVYEFIKDANEDNGVSQQEKLDIINTYSNKINYIQAEITLNNDKLKRRKENLKTIFQKFDITYNLNNLNVGIKQGHDTLRNKIQQAQNLLVQLNEQIWEIPQTTTVSLSGERRRDDIANNIKSVLDRLNQSGKVTIYENKQTLKNGAFSEQTNQNLYATRKINLLWFFLVKAPDNASWEVIVLGKYTYQVVKNDGTVLQRIQINEDELKATIFKNAVSEKKPVKITEPIVVQETKPIVVQETKPIVVQETEPIVVKATVPKVVQETEPIVVQETEPIVVKATVPKVVQATEPLKKKSHLIIVNM